MISIRHLDLLIILLLFFSLSYCRSGAGYYARLLSKSMKNISVAVGVAEFLVFMGGFRRLILISFISILKGFLSKCIATFDVLVMSS